MSEKEPPIDESQPGDESVEDAFEEDYDEELPEEIPTRSLPPEVPASVPTLKFRKVTRPSIPPFMVAKPVFNLDRDDDEVVEELHDRLRPYDVSQRLKNTLDELRRNREDASYKMRSYQANFFMNSILYPYIDGLAEQSQISPLEQLVLLIRQGRTLGSIFEENREQVQTFLTKTEIRMWTTIVRPFLSASEEDIHSRESMTFWLERIKETRSEFYRIIVREPNGLWWLENSLIDCFNFLKGLIV